MSEQIKSKSLAGERTQHTPGLQIALTKMRRNIVPDLSMSTIAESYDDLLKACKLALSLLNVYALDTEGYSVAKGYDYAVGPIRAAIAKAEGWAQ